jgi:hypothetical protein
MNIINPASILRGAIGGVGGILFDPLGHLIEGDKKKSAPPPRGPEKSPEQIAKESRDRILKEQDKERRNAMTQGQAQTQPSLLQSIQDAGADISGGPGAAGRPTGTQNLNNVLATGREGLLS